MIRELGQILKGRTANDANTVGYVELLRFQPENVTVRIKDNPDD